MGDKEICATCLVTDVRLIKINHKLRNCYLEITGLEDRECNSLPPYVCFLCYVYIQQCCDFRRKCLVSQNILDQIYSINEEISKTAIKKIDRKSVGLESSLSFLDVRKTNLVLVQSESFVEEKDPLLIKQIKIESCDQNECIRSGTNNKNGEDKVVLHTSSENVEPKSIVDMKCFKNERTNFNGEAQTEEILIDDTEGETDEAGFDTKPVTNKDCGPVLKEKISTGESILRHFSKKLMSPEDLKNKMSTRKQSASYENKKYKCKLCYTGFNHEGAYTAHCNRHEYGIFGVLQCDICKRYVSDRVHMTQHVTAIHTFKFTCKLCGFIAYTRTSAAYHYDKKHDKKNRKCNVCFKEFRNVHTCSKHMKDHHSTVPCNLCGECFLTEPGLKYHKKHRHGMKHTTQSEVDKEDPFYCYVCETVFADDRAYSTHVIQSSKHSDEEASMIDKKTVQGTGTGIRISRKRATRAIRCKVCNLIMSSAHQIEKHYKNKHPDAEVPREYMCDQCGKAFKSLSPLNIHKNSHTKAKPYQCPVCLKAFPTPSNRYKHIKTIHGEKVFQCDSCDFKCAMKYDLKMHIQTVHMKIPYLPRIKADMKRKLKKLMQRNEKI